MKSKTLLLEEIEREYRYLKGKDVGSEEYDKSMNRLNTLVDKLTDLEKFDEEQRERVKSRYIEIGKAVANGLISVLMALLILKFEQTGSITTALRSMVTNTATKKMF